jgi:predicted ThiF/HesA family dinucleotide-utilizing enzyme
VRAGHEVLVGAASSEDHPIIMVLVEETVPFHVQVGEAKYRRNPREIRYL